MYVCICMYTVIKKVVPNKYGNISVTWVPEKKKSLQPTMGLIKVDSQSAPDKGYTLLHVFLQHINVQY